MDRHPDATPAALDAFRASGWREVISEPERDGYVSMWRRLSDAAKAASEARDLPKAQVFTVLADTCSLLLQTPKSPSEPFAPILVMADGNRSALPEDFDQDALDFLSAVLPEIEDAWLSARISDLLWLRLVPKRIEHARTAIDAYRRIPLDQNTWVAGGRECWERGLALCRLIGSGAENRGDRIEESLLAAFRNSPETDGYFPLWIAQLLREQGRGGDHAREIASKLEKHSYYLEINGDLSGARHYLHEVASWYEEAGNLSLWAAILVKIAEHWVADANSRASSEQPSHVVGVTFLEKAIQIYRKIPGSLRSSHNVDQRIEDLQRKLGQYGERSLGEMRIVSTPPVDISGMVQSVREFISGKSIEEALLALSNLSRSTDVRSAEAQAEAVTRKYPLQSLFPSTRFSSDGRVIARTPGAELGSPDVIRDAVRAQMMMDFDVKMLLAVRGSIIPGREALLAEHRVRESDLVAITRQSPIVPIHRVENFAKALYLGFEGDLAAAVHLLVPQIEHMVRCHMKAAGVLTTTVSQDGIEHEKGLSALMEGEPPERVFGPDLAFEIRALFCDLLGPNLRNQVAHGLLDDASSRSIPMWYAWWFGFHLVFNTFWNATHHARSESNSTVEASEPASISLTDRFADGER